MMKSLLKVCSVGLFAAVPALAEVPVFHENQLVLDEVVTYAAARTRYYRNVRLEMETDGRLRVSQAEVRPLAKVDEIEVTLFEGPAASVQASGLLSIPCVALEEPAVLREGKRFVVVLAETVQESGEVCMSLVAVTPFAVSVPLPLAGLPAGEYSVQVNNAVTSFILSQDQL